MSWWCAQALLICLGIIFLCVLLIKITEASGVGDAVARAAVVILAMTFFMFLIFLAVLLIALPVEMLGKFRAGGYKVSLKQIFLITAAVAIVCAVVGRVVRGF
jgi:hypothetical protein